MLSLLHGQQIVSGLCPPGLCPHASSRPDLAFYHRDNYVVSDVVYSACIPMEVGDDGIPSDQDSEKNVLLGCVGEDKINQLNLSQAIAGMLLLTTRMGYQN